MNANSRYFTPSHEWIAAQGAAWVVGLTNYAVENLGEIVFIEMPLVGAHLAKGDMLCVVESVKAASEIYSPLNCTVVAINNLLQKQPQHINSAPESDGWILKVSLDEGQSLDELLKQEQYNQLVGRAG